MNDLNQFIDYAGMLDYLLQAQELEDAQSLGNWDYEILQRARRYSNEVKKSANLDIEECSISAEKLWFAFSQEHQTSNESDNNNHVTTWLIGYDNHIEQFFHASKEG